jgi:hypothetical protein
MPFTVTASETGDYIITRVTGDMTRELANDFAIAGTELASELGVRCHLIDVTDSRNVESVYDNFIHTRSDVRETGLDRRACVALLTAPDDYSHDTIETFSLGAGLDITVFWDRAEAVAHLQAAAKRLHSHGD